MKNFVLISGLCLILSFTCVIAQDSATTKESNFSLGADFASRYIWRGINLGGGSPHIQPWMKYSFGESGLSVGYWGSFATSNFGKGAEYDLYLSYTPIDLFTVTYTDFFFPNDVDYLDPAYRGKTYFTDWAYGKKSAHTGELMLSFNGTEKLPLTAIFAMNVFGADAKKANGDMVYSKYLELGYSKEFSDAKVTFTLGACLDDPKEKMESIETDGMGTPTVGTGIYEKLNTGDAAGYYNQYSMGVINAGIKVSKELKITDNFSIPMSGSLIMNPESENVYFMLIMSF